MKQLILVRHAKSSWENPGLKDNERPLNDRGLKDAPIMAEWLFRKIKDVDQVVSSNAVRARTTAEYFARRFFGDDSRIQLKEELYHASKEDILKEVRKLQNGFDRVMFFGHNPAFTYFADQFSVDMISNIPTCGIVNIDFQVSTWEDADWKNGQVVFFVYPKMLK